MRFSAFPSLTVVTVLQLLLAVCLAFVALRASITHQRAAEVYSAQLHLRESSATETVPISFVQLASKEAASADRSFTIAMFLAFGIVVLAGFQVWFISEARRDLRVRG
jgi:predicted permease